MDYVIGIDIGTSGTKVLAVGGDVGLGASVTKTYPCYTPHPNWSEQDPEDWWKAVQEGLDEVVAKVGKENVKGIGLSGQMHGMVAMDSDMQVIRPAILWNDQRNTEQCQEIIDLAGGLDSLIDYTNNTMLPGFTGGKILWLKENEPDNYNKVKVVLNPKDYIAYKLTGAISTDVSDASGTGLLDVQNRAWSTELIEKIGLDISFFPEIKESGEVVGEWEGIPVTAGGGDAVLSTIAMGLSSDKQVAVMLGTSGVVSKHADGFFRNDGAKLQFSRACEAGKYHLMGVTLAAAGSYKWLSENLLLDDFRKLDEIASESPAGANGILYLPYLFGERCPINDADASACFVGIKATAGRGDFARAVLEGVAFSLRQVFDLFQSPEVDTIVLAGGGAKSPLWRQIFADVFGRKVITLDGGAEGSGFGAALVAGAGVGLFESVSAAAANLTVKTETTPDPEAVRIYEDRYQEYLKLYPKLK